MCREVASYSQPIGFVRFTLSMQRVTGSPRWTFPEVAILGADQPRSAVPGDENDRACHTVMHALSNKINNDREFTKKVSVKNQRHFDRSTVIFKLKSKNFCMRLKYIQSIIKMLMRYWLKLKNIYIETIHTQKKEIAR